MKTDELIEALSAHVPPVTHAPLGKILLAVMGLAGASAICVMLPDIRTS